MQEDIGRDGSLVCTMMLPCPQRSEKRVRHHSLVRIFHQNQALCAAFGKHRTTDAHGGNAATNFVPSGCLRWLRR